jgi:hypothetical protein
MNKISIISNSTLQERMIRLFRRLIYDVCFQMCVLILNHNIKMINDKAIFLRDSFEVVLNNLCNQGLPKTGLKMKNQQSTKK